jgi:TetR/AcrR family transcriptional regulator
MTRSAEHNQRMRDERRENILHHALRLFAANGLCATKIADIADRAGMSQGLLYHYFCSKEEIFTELIRSAFERMNAAALALEELPMAPRDKILMAITQLVRGIEVGDDFASTVMLIAHAGVSDLTPPEARSILDQQSSVPYGVVERILRAGQQDGSIKEDDAAELSLAFWTTIKGLALHKAVYGEAFKAPGLRIITSMFFTQGQAQGE